ncbi:MAG: AAA family ATPase [Caulobacteraceae bacterium]|nr:AAA family ATPase [Caulobacteraceae bacterium]
MRIYEEKIAGAPQFVSYFGPLLDVLRYLGDEAAPSQIFETIIRQYDVPDEFLLQTNKNGRSKFENRVAWARFYLAKAGLMYAPKRGVWGLTDAGKTTKLTSEQAAEVFKGVQSALPRDEDEQQAPLDTGPHSPVSYWFVGSMWNGSEDQTARFLKEGIWQNGSEDKFSDLVRQMKPGDRIAIKSSYVRLHNVPFENRRRSVSVMRIKTIGTITANRNDGSTVEVDWQPIREPRDWYLYTYRTTVSRARFEDDDMARQLVAFTFYGADQDFSKFLNHPYWAQRFAPEIDPLSEAESEAETDDETEESESFDIYGVADIIAEGGFMPHEEMAAWLGRLRFKKNLILQGPPGTGKTWLAKRLACALIGQKTPRSDQLRSVQFHPSLSYEDFVRGYRPSADGKLELSNGVFLQIVDAAKAQPDLVHVLIIEEINRGNPAQVFGEMLTLLENTKRSRADAMELAYRKVPGERVHVPDNLYVIGTMNIADRSLALVDLALRRRFAFVSLEPTLNSSWQSWCGVWGLSEGFIEIVRERMVALNTEIAEDRALGPQFRLGHSFVTPTSPVKNPREWFRDIVITEIEPLLSEYWFDGPEKSQEAAARLLAGL